MRARHAVLCQSSTTNAEEQFTVEVEGTSEPNEILWEVRGGWLGQPGPLNIDQRNPTLDQRNLAGRTATQGQDEPEPENVRIDGMVETFREESDG